MKLRLRMLSFLMGALCFLLHLRPLPAADFPRTLYVLNGNARTLSKMNLESGQIINDFLQIGQWPNQILSFYNKLYILNSGTNDLMVVDPLRDDQVEQTVALPQGSNPYFMAFVGARRLYVTGLISNSVLVVDLDSGRVVKEIPVGVGPEGILVVENQAFVCNTGFSYPNYGQASVSVIDITTDAVIKTLPVPTNAQDLALAPDGRIHVVCTGNYSDQTGKVVVIDRWGASDFTPAVVDTLDIGGTPGDIVVTASGKGYLCDFGVEPNGFLYSYDAGKDTVYHDAGNPIPVGYGAMRLLYDGRENVLYLAAFGRDAVQKIDVETDQVLATYDFGDGAQDMAIVEPIPESDPWADEVVSFQPGSNWSRFGENYFPMNVLGPPDPDPNIGEYKGSANPAEILSLGHGGEIVLKFTDNRIVNGPGPDFTVFENAFYSPFIGGVFVEAAVVSVSQDGSNWVTFPYDTTTYAGLAGKTPTYNSLEFLDPTVSGGDAFDLEDLGLDWVTYVKLTDLGDIHQEGAFNGDFDLDAVVAVNSETMTAVSEEPLVLPATFVLEQNYPNPFNPLTTIRFRLPKAGVVKLAVYDLHGRLVETLVDGVKEAGTHEVEWNASRYSSGVFFARIQFGTKELTRKLLLVK